MSSKKSNRDRFSNISNSLNSLKLNKEELNELKKAKEILFSLKEKYNLTFNELTKLVEEEKVPASIFNKKLTVLETITKYLKEERNLSLREISGLINRNEKNIWHTLESAKKKYPGKLSFKESEILVPISIFTTNLSALESLVVYLKDKQNLSYHEIAVLLERDDRTIWTVYSRARKKYVN